MIQDVKWSTVMGNNACGMVVFGKHSISNSCQMYGIEMGPKGLILVTVCYGAGKRRGGGGGGHFRNRVVRDDDT